MKRIVPLMLLAALAAGCATPDARIKRNRAAFDALPPEVQENVKKGIIDIGYSKDAVRIALGPPDREYTRRTADGLVEVWSYIGVRVTYERQRADARTRVYDAEGRRRTVTDWVWVDVERRQEFDRTRVEFRNDVVIAVETLDL
jgi:hypothetical protein